MLKNHHNTTVAFTLAPSFATTQEKKTNLACVVARRIDKTQSRNLLWFATDPPLAPFARFPKSTRSGEAHHVSSGTN